MPITQMRTPLGYCTENDVENFLLTDINPAFDTQISNWIAVAEDMVNEYLGYTTPSGVLNEAFVDEVSQTAKVNTFNDLVIFTRKFPIQSVESIELIKGTAALTLALQNTQGVTRYNLPEPKDRIYYPEREITLVGGTLSVGGFGQIKYGNFFTRLSYHAGFTQVPAPISQATAMIVADFILRHENPNGLQMMVQGRVTKSWFQRKDGVTDLVRDAMALLNPYRKTAAWMIR